MSTSPFDALHLPGELLAAQPMTAYLLPRLRMPARAWQIRYTSTTATGGPTQVSGMVMVPPTPYPGPGPRPLIGYGIGTQGLSDACAPSRQLATGTEYEAGILAMALRRGWAIALTDYPGLGTPGAHPYAIGRALGPAVLDCMRAARQLDDAQLHPDGPLGIYGYSEGGIAAGWALQLQPSYAPELSLAGGAVGSPVSDLEAMIHTLDGGWFAFLLLYSLIGINAAYPELGVYEYLNARGRRALLSFADTHIVAAIAKGLVMRSKRYSSYFTHSVFELPDVLTRIRENRLGHLAPGCPVLIGSGTHDQVIPYSQARTLHHDWHALGAHVHLKRLPFREHLTGVISFASSAFRFLGERLNGVECRPPTPLRSVPPLV